MNTKPITPDHLLEGSLEWLHSQTLTWLNEIDFWKEEGKFFYNLLRKKELRAVFPEHEIAILEKEVVCLTADTLEPLKTDLLRHERLLKSLFTHATQTQEAEYRQAHREIIFRITSVNEKIRLVKQRIFSLLKSDA